MIVSHDSFLAYSDPVLRVMQAAFPQAASRFTFPKVPIECSIMAEENTLDLQKEIRIAIRYNTVNVPGVSILRAQRVAEDFASFKMSRHFTFDQDFIHCPSDFDSDTPKSVWILCDFNVGEREVGNFPIQFWKVNYDQNQSA